MLLYINIAAATVRISDVAADALPLSTTLTEAALRSKDSHFSSQNASVPLLWANVFSLIFVFRPRLAVTPCYRFVFFQSSAYTRPDDLTWAHVAFHVRDRYFLSNTHVAVHSKDSFPTCVKKRTSPPRPPPAYQSSFFSFPPFRSHTYIKRCDIYATWLFIQRALQFHKCTHFSLRGGHDSNSHLC